MRTAWFRKLALLGALAWLAPGLSAQSRDALVRLQGLTAELEQGRSALDEHALAQARATLNEARLTWSLDASRNLEFRLALLDFLGATLAGYDPALEAESEGPKAELRGLARDTLEAHRDAEFAKLLTLGILALPDSVPLARRRAAAWLLIPRLTPANQLALFTSARDADPVVRLCALQALCGWQDENVHRFFLERVTEGLDYKLPAWVRGAEAALAEDHFRRVHLGPESRALAALAALVLRDVLAADWRAASRAVKLSRPLDHAHAVPALIEGLRTWKHRAELGLQALRIEHEIVRALEQRSTRKLGMDPARWQEWWDAVQKGEIPGQTASAGVPEEGTHASFFSLHPATDRVTFVLDRSGSMDEPFGVTKGARASLGHSRWDEAVDQLLLFVKELGPQARFNVIVFHDYAEAWKPRLVEASAENRRSARAWLAVRPKGGTLLRSGVERALGLGPDEQLDLSKIEADTLIVLCDGGTEEGPGWVGPFLERVNSLARVVVDAVQIGALGDGTLERLAGGSGGEFLHIDG